jgi:hypothetical protein
MQIFGRAGDALIPMLDLGREKIGEFIETNDRLGATLTGDTGRAAEEFKRKLNEIQTAGEGLALSLTKRLLPVLDGVASELERMAESPGAFLKNAGEDLLTLATGGSFAFTALELLRGKMEELKESSRDLVSGELSQFATLFAASDSFFKKGTIAPPASLGAFAKDTVFDEIGKLQAQASAELALAGATDRSTSSMLFAKAAGEAEQKVAEMRTSLLTEQKSLVEELGNAQRDGQGEEAVRLQARVAGIQHELAALSAAKPQFLAFYSEIAAAREASKSADELSGKSDSIGRQIASLQALADAYALPGEAGLRSIASAQIDKELDAEKQKVEDLREEYAKAQAVPGAGNIPASQGQGPSQALVQLKTALDSAEASFEKMKEEAAQYKDGLSADKIGDQTRAFNDQADAIGAVARAQLLSNAAKRAAEVSAEVAKFKTENRETDFTPAGTAAYAKQVADFAALAQKRSDEAWTSSVAQVAAENQVQGAYLRTRETLEAARAALVASGESTLAIDDRLYNEEISHREELARITFDSQNSELVGLAKIAEERRREIEDWDRMANEAGTFGQKMHTVLNQIALDAQDAGAKIAESIGKAIDSLEDSLAKFIVTGKGSFKQIAETFAESQIKTGLQRLAGGIENKLGVKIPGGPKRDGSSASSALFVQMVGAGGGIPGSESLIGPLFRKPGATPPFFPGPSGVGDDQGSPAANGGIFGVIGAIFGSKGAHKPTGASSDPIYVIQTSAAKAGGGSGGGLAGLFGVSGTPPDGSSGNPFYVIQQGGGSGGDSSGDSGGDSGDSSDGIGGKLSSMFSNIFSKIESVIKTIVSVIEKVASTVVSVFKGIFGGGMAGGGDVTPGKAYVVGERHPEFFVPRSAGTIHPSLAMAGGGHRTSIVNMTVNGVSDADSFRRSQSQIYSGMHAQLAHANSRNG